MFVVTARLRRALPVAAGTAHQLRRVIAASALPAERLEHVYARVAGPDAAVVLFLLAKDLDQAEATAARLLGRVTSGRLAGWRTMSCQAELIDPFAHRALPPD